SYPVSLQELQEEIRVFGKTSLGGSIIPRNESYYYINGELIKFNEKIDFFNSLYGHTMYGARTWAKEKQNQLAKLLQRTGYELLSESNWCSMIKWAQNPKYYLNTEENLIYRWFVRKDKLGPHDIEIYNPLPKDCWYSDKVFQEHPNKRSINFIGIIL
ncbi:2873_t:CDS:2, partial [Gigaspora margarita]